MYSYLKVNSRNPPSLSPSLPSSLGIFLFNFFLESYVCIYNLNFILGNFDIFNET